MVSIEEKAAQKKKSILTATLDLIYERGFHGTPMSLVAERANVGAGTIYRYFKNKEDLITELLWSIKREMVNSLLIGYKKEGPLYDRYRLLIKNLINYLKDDPKKFRFIEQFTFSPFINKSVQLEISLFMQKSLLEFYQDGLGTGMIKEIPFELLFGLVYGTVSFLINMHHNGYYDLNDQDNVESIVHLCWKAITM